MEQSKATDKDTHIHVFRTHDRTGDTHTHTSGPGVQRRSGKITSRIQIYECDVTCGRRTQNTYSVVNHANMFGSLSATRLKTVSQTGNRLVKYSAPFS